MAKYDLASKLNVSKGDFLVVDLPMFRTISIMPIIEVEDAVISAQDKRGVACSSYDDAVVLRQDGTYAIGKNVVADAEDAKRWR